MTVVFGLTVLLQTATPDWMTKPGLLVATMLLLTAAASVILWDEFREREGSYSDLQEQEGDDSL